MYKVKFVCVDMAIPIQISGKWHKNRAPFSFVENSAMNEINKIRAQSEHSFAQEKARYLTRIERLRSDLDNAHVRVEFVCEFVVRLRVRRSFASSLFFEVKWQGSLVFLAVTTYPCKWGIFCIVQVDELSTNVGIENGGLPKDYSNQYEITSNSLRSRDLSVVFLSHKPSSSGWFWPISSDIPICCASCSKWLSELTAFFFIV